jgi:hypothetical protein
MLSKTYLVCAVWFFLALSLHAQPSHGPGIEEWLTDLDHLADRLPRKHANAFHSTGRDGFHHAVNELRMGIPNLNAEEIYVGIRWIVAMVGDGHTNIAIPSHWTWLPMGMRWFGDPVAQPEDLELRIIQVRPPYEAALGTSIVSVGGKPLAEVHAALAKIIAKGESEGSVRAASAILMRRPHLLYGLGLTKTTDSVQFTLKNDDGHEFSVWMTPTAPGTAAPWEYAAPRKMLYQTRPGEQIWSTSLEHDPSILYVAFNEYPTYPEFRRFSRKLFALIDEQQTRRLVIDIRNNTGGNFKKVRKLLIPGLKKRPNVCSPGHLFVLTGPVTFSAAMTNAVDLRRECNAILVGEPTGARPNQYQEGRSSLLPSSKLRVTVSTRYYAFQEEDTPGVIPDHHIMQSWQDHREGIDPVMEWVVAQ